MTELTSSSQKKIRRRTLLVSSCLFLWFLGLFLRLIQLQVIEHRQLRAAAIRQNQLKFKIVPERGSIYDRRGNILARSFPCPSVSLIPSEEETLESRLAKLQKIKGILELSDGDMERIRGRIQKGDSFIWMKRKISPEKALEIKNLNLSEIYLHEENKRHYPLGRLAAHLLGGVNIDDEGASGVELYYDARLKGVAGEGLFLRDARKRRYHRETLKPATPGQDLVLSIDETIQYIAQRELAKAVTGHGASWGTLVISHPASGEILAMASYPDYDPNEFSLAQPEEKRNRAIQYNFEPGSTFKIITAVAARELGLVELDDKFDCRAGKFRVAGWTISDHKPMGILDFREVIVHSSNVGTALVGQRIGPAPLHRIIQLFGFGEKTGIDLPGEESGIFHSLDEWTGSSLASHAIGYGISVTALQMLQAMNILASGGILVRPRIVREGPGPISAFQPGPLPGVRVISEKTARDLVHRVLERVVLEGTGQEARLDGFSVAGKTGTAQKVDPVTGAYSPRRHLASFVGFVPAENPVISMIVVIDEPRTGFYYGGQVAAPVFREVARRVLLYLGLTPRPEPERRTMTAQFRESKVQ